MSPPPEKPGKPQPPGGAPSRPAPAPGAPRLTAAVPEDLDSAPTPKELPQLDDAAAAPMPEVPAPSTRPSASRAIVPPPPPGSGPSRPVSAPAPRPGSSQVMAGPGARAAAEASARPRVAPPQGSGSRPNIPPVVGPPPSAGSRPNIPPVVGPPPSAGSRPNIAPVVGPPPSAGSRPNIPPVVGPPPSAGSRPNIAPVVAGPGARPAPSGPRAPIAPAPPASGPRGPMVTPAPPPGSGPSPVADAPLPAGGAVEHLTAEQAAALGALAAGLDAKDYFELLGLPPSSAPAAIKAAFYQLSRVYHPDRFFQLDDDVAKEDINSIYKRVTEAYYVLRDDRKRKKYVADINGPERAQKLRFTDASETEAKQVAKKEAEEQIGVHPKGRQFWAEAQKSLSRDDIDGAARNLKMALTYEPSNPRYKEEMAKVQARLDVKWKSSGDKFKIR